MEVTNVVEENSRVSFDINNMKPGTGSSLGYYLRRSVLSYDSGLKTIGYSLKSNNQIIKNMFETIDGITDEGIGIFMAIQDLEVLSDKEMEDDSVIVLGYSGSKDLIKIEDLKVLSGESIELKPGKSGNNVIIHNMKNVNIDLTIAVAWNSGRRDKTYNKSLLKKNNLAEEDFIIYSTTHTKVLKSAFDVKEFNTHENLNFFVQLTCGSAKEVVNKAITSLKEDLSMIQEKL